MAKPYVIIHTHTSIDGRIKTIDSPKFKTTSQQYQEIALYPELQKFDIDGYINGRTTSEDNQTLQELDLSDDVEVEAGDFVAEGDFDMYYISLDRNGQLGWTTNYVDYGNRHAHVIQVLNEKVGNGYKYFLRENNISYLIAGEDFLDEALVLEKLQSVFGLNRLMIGGGGAINWSYLSQGLVDEISIVMGPFADGDPENPSLFMAREPYSQIKALTFSLLDVQKLEDDAVWLRYKTSN